MSYRKACPRTLDRPGLEPEELVLVGLVAGAILFVVDAVPAGGAVSRLSPSRCLPPRAGGVAVRAGPSPEPTAATASTLRGGGRVG